MAFDELDSLNAPSPVEIIYPLSIEGEAPAVTYGEMRWWWGKRWNLRSSSDLPAGGARDELLDAGQRLRKGYRRVLYARVAQFAERRAHVRRRLQRQHPRLAPHENVHGNHDCCR